MLIIILEYLLQTDYYDVVKKLIHHNQNELHLKKLLKIHMIKYISVKKKFSNVPSRRIPFLVELFHFCEYDPGCTN